MPAADAAVSSLYQAVPFDQDTTILSIGERTNANGSKAFREAMLEGRWDDCIEIARAQIADGAHLLDVCVDYVGRDGTADMSHLAGLFATASTLPPCSGLDRTCGHRGWTRTARWTQPHQLRELRGRRRAEVPVPSDHADRQGTRRSCGGTDHRRGGQARTAATKVGIATRLITDLVDNWGMDEADIVIDTLTFPIATGQDETRRDAIETIEAIREVKRRFPRVQTTWACRTCRSASPRRPARCSTPSSCMNVRRPG